MMTSDPITRLNAALEGRYRVEREVGPVRNFSPFFKLLDTDSTMSKEDADHGAE